MPSLSSPRDALAVVEEATDLAPPSAEASRADPGHCSVTLPYPVRDRTALDRIKRFIEQNLASYELSPRMICRHIGVSRSQLYRLFSDGDGVARYIRYTG
jgi:AraC-like DNA-binding protein